MNRNTNVNNNTNVNRNTNVNVDNRDVDVNVHGGVAGGGGGCCYHPVATAAAVTAATMATAAVVGTIVRPGPDAHGLRRVGDQRHRLPAVRLDLVPAAILRRASVSYVVVDQP